MPHSEYSHHHLTATRRVRASGKVAIELLGRADLPLAWPAHLGPIAMKPRFHFGGCISLSQVSLKPPICTMEDASKSIVRLRVVCASGGNISAPYKGMV